MKCCCYGGFAWAAGGAADAGAAGGAADSVNVELTDIGQQKSGYQSRKRTFLDLDSKKLKNL